MTITRRRPAAAALAALPAALSAGAALAQGDAGWPSRPVTLVVPCAAGGGPTDAVARILAARPTADLDRHGTPSAMEAPDTRERLAALGVAPQGKPPEAWPATLAAENAEWRDVIGARNTRMQ